MTRLGGGFLVCASLALLLAACSGSDGGGKTAQAPAGGGAGQAGAGGGDDQAHKMAQLRAAQDAAIAAMCERLVDCSVEDARKTMSPEEVTKLDLPHLVPRARDKCEEEYGEHDLSPRQVRVVQTCVNQAPGCQELETCLDKARKQPGAGAASP